VAVYSFFEVAVYDQLGGVVRLARNARITVTDPSTGATAPALKQNGQPVSWVTTDDKGGAAWTSTLGVVRITSPTGQSRTVQSPDYLAEVHAASDTAQAAANSAAASATSAQNAANLVGAPAKSAMDAAMGGDVAGLVPKVNQLGGSTTTGRAVLTAADAAAARTAIGAGTSNLTIGTTSATAKAGDYAPTSAQISDATATGKSLLTAPDAATARAAIGAGTSNLAIGTTASTAKAGNYAPTAAQISDSTTVGRAVLTAADAAAARTAIGVGRVFVVKGLNGTTDASGNVTVAHGAPFTPSAVQAFIHNNGATLALPISTGAITATQVTVRCMNWSAGGVANALALNSALGLVCWE